MPGSAYAELLRKQQEQAAAQAASGMGNPYVTPDMLKADAADFTGEEDAIKQQRLSAQQLRNAPAPEGHSVGPSHIYVGPSWGEVLGNVGERVAGGYFKGKADEADKALDTQRLGKALAHEQIKQGRLQQGIDIKANEDALTGAYRSDQLTRQGEQDAATAAYRSQELAARERDAKATAAYRQSVLDAKNGTDDATLKTFHNPNYDAKDPSSLPTVTYKVDKKGFAHDDAGNVVPSKDLWPWVEPKTGSTKAPTKAQLEAQNDPAKGEGVLPSTVVGRILTSDVLDPATGALNPQRWSGALGYGPQGKEIEALHRDMNTAVLSDMGQNLQRYKLTPLSDTDLKVEMGDVPSPNTHPYGWVDWAANKQRRVYDHEFDKAIKNGVQTKEAKDAFMRKEVDAPMIQAAMKYGYPESKLIAAGVDPEQIKEMKAAKAGAALSDKHKQLSAEEEAIYQQYPQLRPPNE